VRKRDVRPFREPDSAAVSAVLDATYGHDPWLRAIHEGAHGQPLEQPFRRTLVAEVDGEIVGVGTVLHGMRHPLHTWLSIEVAPDFRRRGIGTVLHNKLRELAECPLIARGRLDDPAAVAFLRHHDFRLLNRSWDGTFEPGAVVGRLSEPQAEAQPSLDEAAEFFEQLYQQVHHWSPPTPWCIDQARRFFCGEALVRESLIGVRDKGSLVAAAALTRSTGPDAANQLYLVWAGSLEDREEPARTVLSGCVRFALEAAKRIRFEVDESNVALWAALNELGVLGEATLGIFGQTTADADSPAFAQT
jgi:GNAT superfamily N-acetyltransferase